MCHTDPGDKRRREEGGGRRMHTEMERKKTRLLSINTLHLLSAVVSDGGGLERPQVQPYCFSLANRDRCTCSPAPAAATLSIRHVSQRHMNPDWKPACPDLLSKCSTSGFSRCDGCGADSG